MIDSETVGAGGKKPERPPLLIPKLSGSHREISSGIIPVQYFGANIFEHYRRTFKHLTIQIVLISYKPCLFLCFFCKLSFEFLETKQNRFLC